MDSEERFCVLLFCTILTQLISMKYKIEKDETMEQCAERELLEESGVTAAPGSLDRVGYLVFTMLDSRKILRVHVYETWSFEGVPMESEEMQPRWYEEQDIPLHEMWPDDRIWLRHLLEGSEVEGHFEYLNETTIKSHTLTTRLKNKH